MKKINMILGACAIAAAALLVSCNNGTKDYVNVSQKYNSYYYDVTGSVTTTEKSGTTSAASVNVTTETIKTAKAYVSWTDDKVNESNYDEYKVKIGGSANWTNSYTAAGATTATTTKWNDGFGSEGYAKRNWPLAIPAGYYTTTVYDQIQMQLIGLSSIYGNYNNPMRYDDYMSLRTAVNMMPSPVSTTIGDPTYDSDPDYRWYSGCNMNVWYNETVINNLELVFFEFDGDYYINFNNEYVKLPEDAFDGDFGDDEFTLKFTETTADTRWNMDADDLANTTYVGSSETTYNFTFKLVEAE